VFTQLTDKFDTIFRNLRGLGKITDSNIQQTVREIRRVLLDADVNFHVARDFIKRVQERAGGTKVIKSVKPGEHFIKIIHQELIDLLGKKVQPIQYAKNGPTIILMAGLQGSGKTTTCSKLAYRLKTEGKSSLLVAADVYRPAAIDQLKVLGKRINVPVFSLGTINPVEICKKAIIEAKHNNIDVVILDTAGRLHIDDNMMAEIKSISEKVSPNEILFVVDGMTGQDAVQSALTFSQTLPLTGTILTKMDGDARGGAAVSITEVTGVPIKFIGVSEKTDGLESFDPKRIVDRILGFGDVISLVEKAESVMKQQDIDSIQNKLHSNTFTLEDFKEQIQQIKQMGPVDQLLGMVPGMNRKMLKGLKFDNHQMKWTEAIIQSMTPGERKNPQIINGSRRQRIAKGSGRSVQEINQLLKQFTQMQKMMKKIGKTNLPHKLGKQMNLGQFIGLT